MTKLLVFLICLQMWTCLGVQTGNSTENRNSVLSVNVNTTSGIVSFNFDSNSYEQFHGCLCSAKIYNCTVHQNDTWVDDIENSTLSDEHMDSSRYSSRYQCGLRSNNFTETHPIFLLYCERLNYPGIKDNNCVNPQHCFYLNDSARTCELKTIGIAWDSNTTTAMNRDTISSPQCSKQCFPDITSSTPSSTQSTASDVTEEKHGSEDMSIIIGVVLGLIILVAILVVIGVVICRRRRKAVSGNISGVEERRPKTSTALHSDVSHKAGLRTEYALPKDANSNIDGAYSEITEDGIVVTDPHHRADPSTNKTFNKKCDYEPVGIAVSATGSEYAKLRDPVRNIQEPYSVLTAPNGGKQTSDITPGSSSTDYEQSSYAENNGQTGPNKSRLEIVSIGPISTQPSNTGYSEIVLSIPPEETKDYSDNTHHSDTLDGILHSCRKDEARAGQNNDYFDLESNYDSDVSEPDQP